MVTLNPESLEQFRSVFLERMPDFGDFSDQDGKYWEYERAYKVNVADFVRAQLHAGLFEGSSHEYVEQIVQATKRTLTGRVSVPGSNTAIAQNIIGWRYWDFIRKLDHEAKQQFAAAMGDLLYGGGSDAERVGRFTDSVWPLYRPAAKNKPYALSRIFPTFYLMCFRPRSNIAVRTDMFDIASKQLTGDSVLSPEPLGVSGYDAVLKFSEAVYRQLESWAWCPRDMIDVHSFLWIVTRPSSEYAKANQPT
jgi:hypothetical protein